MKKFMIPVFLGVMAMTTPAFAWAHVNGHITSIDSQARQIALDNGRTYTLDSHVKPDGLAVGDKVTVNAETVNAQNGGKQNIVNKVTKLS
jgi:hypothetical protein